MQKLGEVTRPVTHNTRGYIDAVFLRIFLVLGLATVVLAGCRDGSAPTAAPTSSATPIENLNTAQMRLPRIDFCSLIPKPVVDDALAVGEWKLHDWKNGDQAPVTGQRQDVVAEHLCQWTATSGDAVARAWMFARPVSPAFARRVIGSATRDDKDCQARRTTDFGKPSMLQTCQTEQTSRVRRAGLFLDTWLTCEISDTTPAATLRQRADAWCSQIATTLNTTH